LVSNPVVRLESQKTTGEFQKSSYLKSRLIIRKKIDRMFIPKCHYIVPDVHQVTLSGRFLEFAKRRAPA
jgi:hypothetical protein